MSSTSIATRWFPAAETAEECKCGVEGCLGHEVVDTIVQFPGFTSAVVADRCTNPICLLDLPAEDGVYVFTDDPEMAGATAGSPALFLYRWRPRE
jgi:hypothetical protein